MNMRVFALLLVVALAASPQGPPVNPDQEAVIKVDVDLVNVLASVRGKNGALIGNLAQSDFRVFEDGKEQPIKFFSRETDLPLTIGLLIDVSGSMERLIDTERRAAGQFFTQVLGKKDLAFLISFGYEVELLQDSTNSTRLLREGLGQLRPNVPVGGIHPGPVPTSRPRAGTILYDAVFLAAEDRLKGEAGRKAVIVITDGVDTGSKKSRDQAIEAAHKADAIIYGIYYADNFLYGGDEGVLKRMAGDTGGRVFDLDRRNSLEDAFRQIQEEMRSQYAIGYSSTNTKKDGSFRKIEIRTTNKDHKVQTRKGYYAADAAK